MSRQHRLINALPTSPEGLPEYVEALGNGRFVVFFALELQRHITSIVMFLESRRNFRVVKIKGIPLATAEVSFCLDINGMRRHLFLLLVDVFQKITRVEGDLKPR